jgi:outer membrane lipoprotein-sorting protein
MHVRFFSPPLSISFLFGQELSPEYIIRKVDEVMNPPTAYSKVKFINVLESGKVRRFEYESWAKEKGKKMLIRYTAPRRVAGQAILLLNNANDIWMYFPRTNRIRKMASHAKKQKFEGSNFTYEDFGSGDAFVKDFHSKLVGEERKNGRACYKLELIRKPEADISYSRLILWVDRQLFIPIEIHYFDDINPNRLKKILLLEDIEIIQHIPTAKKMIMKNVENRTETRMELLHVQYNLKISDRMFTEHALKRR